MNQSLEIRIFELAIFKLVVPSLAAVPMEVESHPVQTIFQVNHVETRSSGQGN